MEKASVFPILSLPHQSYNQPLDELAFSIKSHTERTKLKLHIVEGIIGALRRFEVAC